MLPVCLLGFSPVGMQHLNVLSNSSDYIPEELD